MATTPSFTSTARIGRASVATANTARDGTGTLVDVISAVTAGTRIFEIVVKSSGQPADSVITLFINDGTNTYLFDEIDMGAPAAGSTTAVSYRTSVTYSNLVLPSGYKLVAGVTVAPTSGAINVIAFGGDLT